MTKLLMNRRHFLTTSAAAAAAISMRPGLSYAVEGDTLVIRGQSDIDAYAATSPVECFAVVAEYFFEQRDMFRERHQDWSVLLEKVFIRNTV